jgi:hypothetical protein
LELQAQLEQDHSGFLKGNCLPTKYVWNRFDEGTLQKRQQSLEQYLQGVVNFSEYNIYVREFLGFSRIRMRCVTIPKREATTAKTAENSCHHIDALIKPAVVILRLPIYLLRDVWVHWLDLLAVAHADSAFCARSERTAFLHSAYHPSCQYDCSRHFDTAHSKRNRLFEGGGFIRWAHIRSIRVSSLAIYTALSDESNLDDLTVSVIRHSGHHLKAIKVCWVSEHLCSLIEECCPVLESVHVFDYSPAPPNCQQFASLIRCTRTLRRLNLDTPHPGDRATFAALAQCGAQLQSLSVCGDNYVADWRALQLALPSLTELNVTHTQVISAGAIAWIARHCPCLVSLRLSSVDNWLDDRPNVHTSMVAVADNCTRLQHLQFPIQCSAAIAIEVLARCRSLTSIHLAPFVTGTAEVVQAVAGYFPALRALVIPLASPRPSMAVPSGPESTGAGALDEPAGSLDFFCDLLSCLPCLEELCLSNGKASDLLLRAVGNNCPKLRILTMQGYIPAGAGITDEGIVALAKGCPMLRTVRLSTAWSIKPSTAATSTRLTNAAIHAIIAHCRQIELVEIDHQCNMFYQLHDLEMLPAFRRFLVITECWW